MLPEEEAAVSLEDELDQLDLDLVVLVDAVVDLLLVRSDLGRDGLQDERIFACEKDKGGVHRDPQFCDPVDRRLDPVFRAVVRSPVFLDCPESP